MSKKIEGNLSAKGFKFALIISRFNNFITSNLLSGAYDCLKRHEAESDNITEFWVPGSFEIPIIAQKLADSGKYDAIICLSAIIRGETPHFDFVASEVTKGIAQTSLKYNIPIAFGVLTTENIEQAIDRAGTKSGNKGWEAALSAIEMINLIKSIDLGQ